MIAKKMESTSRERILTTLHHKEPDTIPLDLGGMGSTGIMAVSYVNLRRYCNMPEVQIVINDVGQQLAEIHEDMLLRLGVDVVSMHRVLPPCLNGRKNKFKPFLLTDPAGYMGGSVDALIPDEVEIVELPEGLGMLDRFGNVQFLKPSTSYFFDPVYHPLAKTNDPSDIDRLPHWKLLEEVRFEEVAAKARYLAENTDYAIMVSAGGQFVEAGQLLCGWEEFMVELAYGSNFIDRLLHRLLEYNTSYTDKLLGAVKDYVQVVVFGDDLGTQNAPIMSPELYRRMMFPYHKALYSFVHENYPGVKVFLHSCGSIYRLIPMLIEAGVDILNPVQTNAAEMNPARLKREFGKGLVFWGGGVDSSALTHGTPELVRQMVKERLDIFAPGGGFVFCQVHNHQGNYPVENIAAMYEALAELR